MGPDGSFKYKEKRNKKQDLVSLFLIWASKSVAWENEAQVVAD